MTVAIYVNPGGVGLSSAIFNESAAVLPHLAGALLSNPWIVRKGRRGGPTYKLQMPRETSEQYVHLGPGGLIRPPIPLGEFIRTGIVFGLGAIILRWVLDDRLPGSFLQRILGPKKDIAAREMAPIIGAGFKR